MGIENNALQAGPGAPQSVLVVDDDELLCQLSAKVLAEHGYEVFTAYNGKQGLSLYKAHRPDAIILDLSMPGVSGFQVANEVRQSEPPGKHTIIIILTAYTRSYFDSKNVDTQIDSFLTKPVLPQDLVAHVASLLS